MVSRQGAKERRGRKDAHAVADRVAGCLTRYLVAVRDAEPVAEVGDGGRWRRPRELRFDGEAVDPPSPLTLMLHKPLGYTCSHKEAGALVYDLLPERFRHRKPALSSVGRLDKDSTGQLLFTDDGELLHRIIHPKTHAPKHYRVTVQKTLRGDEAALFSTGAFKIEGEEKPLLPALWRADRSNGGVMILTEGRYHQIRRMFSALGNRVTALHRFQTGGLPMGELKEGAYRFLSPAEVQSIFAESR